MTTIMSYLTEYDELVDGYLLYIHRNIDFLKITKVKSCFVFGPRQTGKTSIIRETLSNALVVNLLLNETFLRFSQNPSLLREIATDEHDLIVIDEVQRLPDLLNEVHYLIEEKGKTFLLTGSSARKLRRAGINLLGGRARFYNIHPLSISELQQDFDLLRALNVGLIPSIYLSDEPKADLASYVGLYLKEEIAAEALTRNLEAYSRFLQVAARSNGQLVNYTNIASDAQVPRTTVIEYFKILVDTLLASWLPPFKHTVKRKSVSTSKFYLFDNGVTGFLQERGKIRQKSPAFGEAFEAYIHHELRTYIDYNRLGTSLHFWRSTTHFEVDFILDGNIAIEVKGKTNVAKKDLSGLRAFMEEGIVTQYHVVSLEPLRRQTEDGIIIWPWQEFVERLWSVTEPGNEFLALS